VRFPFSCSPGIFSARLANYREFQLCHPPSFGEDDGELVELLGEGEGVLARKIEDEVFIEPILRRRTANWQDGNEDASITS
jgi:hypothetical protein